MLTGVFNNGSLFIFFFDAEHSAAAESTRKKRGGVNCYKVIAGGVAYQHEVDLAQFLLVKFRAANRTILQMIWNSYMPKGLYIPA